MIPVQNCKEYVVFDPISVTSAATATGYVDTLGYDYCTFRLMANTATASTAWIACKVSESADATNTTNVATLLGGTAFDLPACATATVQKPIAILNVDCRGRERYLHLHATPFTTSILASSATLYRAKQAPVGATLQNAYTVVNA